MRLILLALALLDAPATEQYAMVANLHDADPRLAVEVLDMAAELGADTDELAIVVAIIADSTGDDDDALYKDPGKMFDPQDDSSDRFITRKKPGRTSIGTSQSYVW